MLEEADIDDAAGAHTPDHAVDRSRYIPVMNRAPRSGRRNPFLEIRRPDRVGGSLLVTRSASVFFGTAPGCDDPAKRCKQDRNSYRQHRPSADVGIAGGPTEEPGRHDGPDEQAERCPDGHTEEDASETGEVGLHGGIDIRCPESQHLHRISPALDTPGCVLRLDAVQTAPSLCVLARATDASARSARTYDSGH